MGHILLGMIICICMYLVPRAVHLALSFFFDTMIFAFLVWFFSPFLFIILILVNVFIYHKVGWILILLRKEKKNYISMYVSLLVYIYTSCQSDYSVQSSLWLVYTSMHLVVSPFHSFNQLFIRRIHPSLCKS